MNRFLIKRLMETIPTLWGITIICFLVIHLAPGNPVRSEGTFNPNISMESLEKMKKIYHLDKPLWKQYAIWLNHLIRLDFGRSLVDGKKVIEKIGKRLPITIIINATSLFIIIIISVPLGVISAVKENSLFDKFFTVFVFAGYSIPAFWLALLLMILFGVHLRLLPISGVHSIGAENLGIFPYIWDMIKHLILPVSISAFAGLAAFSRYTRKGVIQVLKEPYIKLAYAKGLSQNEIIFKHALKNALLPLITILGLALPTIIGGSVIFETIFSIPGMGQLFYQSAMSRDYPTIMGVLIIGASLTLIGNLLADILYILVDPRLKENVVGR
jgi:peptide/nickel transport system permease protein